MIRMAKDDVLRGLKRCKRLAKQDLLASSFTGNPQFWNRQAEARRELYGELMAVVEQNGVEQAYRLTVQRYAALPLSVPADGEMDPTISGRRQALEMFLAILGVNGEDALKTRGEAHLAGASL